MEERIYKKGDKEYIKNGHFSIEGQEWMTMWAFNNDRKVYSSPELNAMNSSALNHSWVDSHKCIPDLYPNQVRYMYPIKLLKEKFEEAESEHNKRS